MNYKANTKYCLTARKSPEAILGGGIPFREDQLGRKGPFYNKTIFMKRILYTKHA